PAALPAPVAHMLRSGLASPITFQVGRETRWLSDASRTLLALDPCANPESAAPRDPPKRPRLPLDLAAVTGPSPLEQSQWNLASLHAGEIELAMTRAVLATSSNVPVEGPCGQPPVTVERRDGAITVTWAGSLPVAPPDTYPLRALVSFTFPAADSPVLASAPVGP